MDADSRLLTQYVEDHSQTAFAALVQRHVDLVYSAALRQLGGDAHLAWDAAQGVFLALAQNAPRLIHHAALTGWLYTTTRFVCAKLVRTRQRARSREAAFSAMNEIHDDDAAAADWGAVRAVLDDAMHELGPGDREALLLRHFEGLSFGEIGGVWGLGENAARMRVERAMEKLRSRLARRGITSTAIALGTTLAAHGVATAPAGLANAAATLAFAGATTAAAGMAGTVAWLQFMSTMNLKAAAIAGVVAFAVGSYFGVEWQRRAERARTAATAWPQTAESTRPHQETARAAAGKGTPGTGAAQAASDANPDPAADQRPGAGLNAAEQNALLQAQQALATSIRAGLDQRYGGLFWRLKLPPAQLEKLRDLLVERQMSTNDAVWVAQQQGIKLDGDPAQLKAAMDKVRAEVDEGIRTAIGDDGYRVYEDYNQNASSYTLLDLIERRLSYTDAPLQDAQSQPLLRLLIDTAAPAPSPLAQGPLAGVTAAMSGSDPLLATAVRGPISDAAIARAPSILSPAQMETLRQIQSEQKSQAEATRGLIQGDPDAGKPAPTPPATGPRPSSTP